MKSQYKRMYETKNVRPYYTIVHIGIGGKASQDLTGFGYKKGFYIISSEMNNSGYFDVDEMKEATEHFRKFWEDDKKVQELLKHVKETFEKAVEVENYGWKHDWKSKSTEELLKEMDKFFNCLFYTMTRMFISQPQHVLPLDQKITALLEGKSNSDQLLLKATYYPGDLPWADEDREIASLHKVWTKLSEEEKDKNLKDLVKKYGWFNEIEGDRPFDKEHYKNKIINFSHIETKIPDVSVPAEIMKVGQLIGELGFLRFWNRYHFMTLRYHLKKIIEELVKRSGNPDLEFATTKEINDFFSGNKIDLEEIVRRKSGYAAYLKDGYAELVTGKEYEKYKELAKEDIENITEIKGSIANKGKITGKVRIISFTSKEYSQEVAAFQKGEILVTGMTRPQIVHLCKIASAIITDEGGITSHAAVVSREFGLPCIIATHNATKVLKTGDMVEVDADTGVIRKI